MRNFTKYNITAIVATGADFLVLLFFKEVLNLWYFLAAILGTSIGGVVGFIMTRNWVFKKKNGKISSQAIKYIIVSGTAMLLNLGGLHVFTEYFGIQYFTSRVIVAIIVGIGFSFFAQKNFAFK